MPRDQRYTALVIGIFCLALGIVGVAVYGFLSFREYEYAFEGKVAIGVVTGGDASDDSSSVTYSFKDSAEHPYTGSAAMNKDGWDTISVGAPCSITYLRDEPSINRLTNGEDNSKRAAFALLVGIILLLAGGILCRSGMILIERLKELPEAGVKTEGIVALEELENLDTESGDKKLSVLVYSYQDQKLSHFTFGFKLDDPEVEYWRKDGRLQKGITIFYDPAEPTFHLAEVASGLLAQGSSSVLVNTKLLTTSNADVSNRARNVE